MSEFLTILLSSHLITKWASKQGLHRQTLGIARAPALLPSGQASALLKVQVVILADMRHPSHKNEQQVQLKYKRLLLLMVIKTCNVHFSCDSG